MLRSQAQHGRALYEVPISGQSKSTTAVRDRTTLYCARVNQLASRVPKEIRPEVASCAVVTIKGILYCTIALACLALLG